MNTPLPPMKVFIAFIKPIAVPLRWLGNSSHNSGNSFGRSDRAKKSVRQNGKSEDPDWGSHQKHEQQWRCQRVEHTQDQQTTPWIATSDPVG